MELKDKCIRFDWAVKYSLRSKINFCILEGFLTVLLGEKISAIEILENRGKQQWEGDKPNRMIIKARNNEDEIILVEIQNTHELYYWECILYGASQTLAEYIDWGRICSDIKKVYSVNILYFDIGQGSDYLYHGQNTFWGVHTGDNLKLTTKEQNIIVRKLPFDFFWEYFLIRINKFDKIVSTPLEEWIEYLKTGRIRSNTKVPGLEEARKTLSYYNMDTAEKLAYDRHIDAVMIQNDVLSTAKLEGYEEGRQLGLEEGREMGFKESLEKAIQQGVEKEKTTIARKLKSLNVPIGTIMEVTGLSLEEIERF